MNRALRVGLYSSNSTVRSLLTSALNSEYCFVTDFGAQPVSSILKNRDDLDVLVIDFDSRSCTLEQQLAAYDEIGETSVPIIVMTDDLRRSTAMEFLRRGAFDCIRKPPSLAEFKVIVGRAHEHAEMKAELAKKTSPQRCDELLGSSKAAVAVYDLIARVANVSASVLITGESGTGKELVARAIHNTGNRSGEPFVAVSCGAIPETLIEAELFGTERGAYTGSTTARAGYLEEAGSGTLFLDEIGELSPTIQVKLLRVLQQREFSRLGSNRLIPLKARVLFATHRDLNEMTDTGAFRKDLFYRVNVLNIHVPPLRERTDDIPMLARHFVKRYSAEYGKPVDDILPTAMAGLVDYDWPGNIRELENVIQGAVIRTDESSIGPADLPDALQPGPSSDLDDTGFDFLLRRFKVELINRTVEECNGNKSLAARKLGLSRTYVHRLVRHGFDAEAPSFAESA